eukprot:1175722-Prorocentrum_minimum.AAC.2
MVSLYTAVFGAKRIDQTNCTGPSFEHSRIGKEQVQRVVNPTHFLPTFCVRVPGCRGLRPPMDMARENAQLSGPGYD